METFYTTKELAELLKVSLRSLIRLRQDGQGPGYVHLGRSVRYPESEVDKWKEREVKKWQHSEKEITAGKLSTRRSTRRCINRSAQSPKGKLKEHSKITMEDAVSY